MLKSDLVTLLNERIDHMIAAVTADNTGDIWVLFNEEELNAIDYCYPDHDLVSSDTRDFAMIEIMRHTSDRIKVQAPELVLHNGDVSEFTKPIELKDLEWLSLSKCRLMRFIEQYDHV
jgi:hypothetical protein